LSQPENWSRLGDDLLLDGHWLGDGHRLGDRHGLRYRDGLSDVDRVGNRNGVRLRHSHFIRLRNGVWHRVGNRDGHSARDGDRDSPRYSYGVGLGHLDRNRSGDLDGHRFVDCHGYLAFDCDGVGLWDRDADVFIAGVAGVFHLVVRGRELWGWSVSLLGRLRLELWLGRRQVGRCLSLGDQLSWTEGLLQSVFTSEDSPFLLLQIVARNCDDHRSEAQLEQNRECVI